MKNIFIENKKLIGDIARKYGCTLDVAKDRLKADLISGGDGETGGLIPAELHAEANAIISASRRECIGATIYLVGKEASTGKILGDATSCSMCRRMIINAGIERVVIRKTETEFSIVPVQQWIEEDDSIADLDYIPQK